MSGYGKDTKYGGYLFRSRLEARWAIFFDVIGERWSYELKDFALNGGMRYLPDFCLYEYTVDGLDFSCNHLWCEVKGCQISDYDMKKITGMYEIGEPVLVLGDIPRSETYDDLINEVPLSSYGYDNRYGNSGVYPFNFLTVDGDFFGLVPCAAKSGGLILPGDDGNYLYDDLIDKEKTVRAYQKARQARFEFGQTPTRLRGDTRR